MLGHLIYTFDRIDDARVQMELSKALYPGPFGGLHLVHAFNGDDSFGYTPYLEDHLITRPNKGHYRGAVDLINAGLEYFEQPHLREIRFVLITASDTWAVDIPLLEELIADMEANERVIAASSWRTKAPEQIHGFSLDFFIIDRYWNQQARIFPLDYDDFCVRYGDLLALLYFVPIPEAAFQTAYHRYFLERHIDNEVRTERDRRLRRITEREPACIRENDFGRERTGIWHSHCISEKQELLRRRNLNCGEHSSRLIRSTELAYFNAIPSAGDTIPVQAGSGA